MIQIKGTIMETYDDSLAYFEPWIKSLTNMILKSHPDKEDCRQELRLKLWSLHEKDNMYNSTYVSTRLKWDTINFINRDTGYNWDKKFKSFEVCAYTELERLFSVKDYAIEKSLNVDIEVEDMILKAKSKLSQKQYEALILFLSGANSKMISSFLGTRNRNITRYYLLLGEAINILREVAIYE
jgi:hypothetical protein